MNKILSNIFYLLPDFYKEKIIEEAKYAKKRSDIESKLVKSVFFLSTIILIPLLFSPYPLWIEIIAGAIALITIPFFIPLITLRMLADRRKNNMERVLPDVLKLIAANMEAGNTIEKSFMLSARDELGDISEELRQTGMQIYGGESIEKSLQDMQNRVKSELLKETIKIIADANESGGNMAKLLQTSARDVQQSLEMKKEIKSSIRMYAVFILMVTAIFAPILFAVSLHTAEVTKDMWTHTDLDTVEMDASGQIGLDLTFEPPQIDIDLFRNFSIATLIITNIFAALIISEIRNGNITNGFKYMPLMIAVALIAFTGASIGVESLMETIN